MAKNVVIQTDGTAVTYSGVKEIETNDPEQGRVTWIPMDETELAIKTVNANGTYKAKDDGYYGYRKFTVATNNKGKTVGTKSDGRTYAVDTDEDGYLTETLLPDNIRINPQPTKTTYSDGELISLAGAVVKAYSKDDIWEGEGYSGGVIPHGELTLEPDTASGEGGSTVIIDGVTYTLINPSAVEVSSETSWNSGTTRGTVSPLITNLSGEETIYAIAYQLPNLSYTVLMFSKRQFTGVDNVWHRAGAESSTPFTANSVTYAGQTFYLQSSGITGDNTSHINVALSPNPDSETQNKIAVEVLYGGGGGGEKSATSNLDVTPLSKPFLFSTTGFDFAIGYQNFVASGAKAYTTWADVYMREGWYHGEYGLHEVCDARAVFASDEPFVLYTNGIGTSASQASIDNKSVYYATGFASYYTADYDAYSGLNTASGVATDNRNVAWTMIHGIISGGGEATDKVTVKWNRPEDDEELTTTFNITVS